MKKIAFLVLGLALVASGCGGGGGSSGGSASVASLGTQVATGATTPGSTTGSTKPAITVDVKLAASKPVAVVGDAVDVRLEATGVSALYGAGVDLSYDPAVLEYVSVTAGGLIPNSFAAGGLRNGKAGVVTVAVSTEGSAAGGTGSGTLVTVRFKAKAKGSTSVAPSDLVLEDASGTPGLSPGLGPVNIAVN